MRNKVAKKLKLLTYSVTVGLSKQETRKKYKQMKRNYKKHHGQI